MPNWIGDFVMATPILTDLRKKFPEAEITAMCKNPLGDLLKEDEDINELFSFSRLPNGFSRRIAKRNIIEKLRSGEYDAGLLLTNSFSSAWWFWQGKVQNRVGYSCNVRSIFLNYPIVQENTGHQVVVYKRLLQPFGIDITDTPTRLFLQVEEVKKSKELLYHRGYVEGKKLIGIHPGAAYGSSKCWPWERYRAVAKKLLENPELYVLFFGDITQTNLIKNISQGLGPRAINLAGITAIRELMALIKDLHLFLTNDSGPMHIASALGTPLIALFGSTDDRKTGPYKGGVVLNKHASCSPCFKRRCPIDFRCMMEITVEEVLAEMKKYV